MFVLEAEDSRKRLEALYELHGAAVLRFALRCTGRHDLAEDLTSEAFLALHRNLNEIEAGRLPSWLFTVVKNLAVDHWRKRSKEEVLPEPSRLAAPPVAHVEPVEELLLRAKGLKPVHRICLTLRYVHGMDRAEIARQTGMSDNQIKSALQYAIELLRKELGGVA